MRVSVYWNLGITIHHTTISNNTKNDTVTVQAEPNREAIEKIILVQEIHVHKYTHALVLKELLLSIWRIGTHIWALRLSYQLKRQVSEKKNVTFILYFMYTISTLSQRHIAYSFLAAIQCPIIFFFVVIDHQIYIII